VLRERGHEVLLFVSEKGCGSLALKEHPEIPFEKLPTIGLPSPFSPTSSGFVRRFNESFRRCRSIYRRFDRKSFSGWAGYFHRASSRRKDARRSNIIHEPNAIPGKANKMTARLVRAVRSASRMRPFFPKVKTEVTARDSHGMQRLRSPGRTGKID